MQPDLLGDCPERLALLRQMADLFIALAPMGMARGRSCGGKQECSRVGRRGRRRRLDDGGLGSPSQGAPSGWHVEFL
jgi:hypothetical protein